MAIPQLNLDDRTFDQLTTEARALIQRYCPVWTDYNPPDPGITLLELFAFVVEAAIYQINRVPERSLERFANLVGVQRQPGEAVAQTLARAHNGLNQQYRAVTESDFEALARAAASDVARARAVVSPAPAPISSGNGGGPSSPGFFPADSLVKIIIVPVDSTLVPAELDALCQSVFQFLKPRTLITTKINVVPSDYTMVNLSIAVARAVDSRVDVSALGTAITASLTNFLDDRTGGNDGQGWPFGRALYRSDVYRLVEGINGVDHVEQLLLHVDGSPEDDTTRAAIPLISPWSLVRLSGLAVSVN